MNYFNSSQTIFAVSFILIVPIVRFNNRVNGGGTESTAKKLMLQMLQFHK